MKYREVRAKRREYLAGICATVPLAGCLNAGSGARRTPNRGGIPANFGVEAVEVPGSHRLEYEVGFETPTADESGVARLRVEVSNGSGERLHLSGDNGRRPIVPAVNSEGLDPGLSLVGVGASEENRGATETESLACHDLVGRPSKKAPAGDCWRCEHPAKLPIATRSVVTLEPGATAVREYEVWDYHENEGPCFARGTYRFENRCYLSTDRDQPEQTGFSWSVSVQVEDGA